MLELLHIENVAVVKKLDIEFSSGLTVLTGETGAGKSIIIDSLNLISGARADKELIRKIKKIDADRKRYHGLISELQWGDKRGYHLCVNTSGREIKTIVPLVAAYYKLWSEEQK